MSLGASTKPGTFIVLEGADGSGKSTQAERLAANLKQVTATPVHFTREPSDGPIGLLIREALAGRVQLSEGAMGHLFAADRANHVAHDIAPALLSGAHVVCDRFDLSNIIYRAAETPGPFLLCSHCAWEGEPGDAVLMPAERPRPLNPKAQVFCPRATCRMPLSPLPLTVMRRVEAVRAFSAGLGRPGLTIVLLVSPAVAKARREARLHKMRTYGAIAPNVYTHGAILPGEIYDGEAMQARCCLAYEMAHELLPGDRIAFVDGTLDEDAVTASVWAAVEKKLGR